MKTLLIAAALLISSVSQATSLHPDTFAERVNLEVVQQAEHYQTVESAELVLNKTTKMVRLTMKFHQICPPPRPGQFACRAASRPDLTIELPILKESFGSCGSKVYDARVDRRQGDGSLQMIRVVDFRSNSCMALTVLEAMTRVEYTEITSGFGYPAQTFKFTFKGPALRSPLR